MQFEAEMCRWMAAGSESEVGRVSVRYVRGRPRPVGRRASSARSARAHRPQSARTAIASAEPSPHRAHRAARKANQIGEPSNCAASSVIGWGPPRRAAARRCGCDPRQGFRAPCQAHRTAVAHDHVKICILDRHGQNARIHQGIRNRLGRCSGAQKYKLTHGVSR